MKISLKTYSNIYFAFIFLCILFLLSGCIGPGGSEKKIAYYTLEYAAPQPAGSNTLPLIINIGRFRSPLYNSDKIVYRKNDFQTDGYVYHRWDTNPSNLVSYFLYRDMKNSGLFKGVFTYDAGLAATHSISGSVDDFFEDDRTKAWEAVLSIDIVLTKENEHDLCKKIIFQKKYTTSKACDKKNPKALAKAMSNAMQELSAQIIADVYKSLSAL